ncbi:MAG: hypothetical protein M1828_005267 [Chrysothrix sp. TS-e1954]|nr:MAG: hypothetical protein M1828_005267 [Chrysothrix sp. TS-e1954]
MNKSENTHAPPTDHQATKQPASHSPTKEQNVAKSHVCPCAPCFEGSNTSEQKDHGQEASLSTVSTPEPRSHGGLVQTAGLWSMHKGFSLAKLKSALPSDAPATYATADVPKRKRIGRFRALPMRYLVPLRSGLAEHSVSLFKRRSMTRSSQGSAKPGKRSQPAAGTGSQEITNVQGPYMRGGAPEESDKTKVGRFVKLFNEKASRIHAQLDPRAKPEIDWNKPSSLSSPQSDSSGTSFELPVRDAAASGGAQNTEPRQDRTNDQRDLASKTSKGVDISPQTAEPRAPQDWTEALRGEPDRPPKSPPPQRQDQQHQQDPSSESEEQPEPSLRGGGNPLKRPKHSDPDQPINKLTYFFAMGNPKYAPTPNEMRQRQDDIIATGAEKGKKWDGRYWTSDSDFSFPKFKWPGKKKGGEQEQEEEVLMKDGKPAMRETAAPKQQPADERGGDAFSEDGNGAGPMGDQTSGAVGGDANQIRNTAPHTGGQRGNSAFVPEPTIPTTGLVQLSRQPSNVAPQPSRAVSQTGRGQPQQAQGPGGPTAPQTQPSAPPGPTVNVQSATPQNSTRRGNGPKAPSRPNNQPPVVEVNAANGNRGRPSVPPTGQHANAQGQGQGQQQPAADGARAPSQTPSAESYGNT